MRTALRAYTAASAGPVAILTVIGEGSTLGERGRGLIGEMMRELDPKVEAWGITIEGEGFWGTTARAMTATVRLFSRTSHPFKVTGKPEEGLAWLQQKTRRSLPDDVLPTLALMRAALAKLPP